MRGDRQLHKVDVEGGRLLSMKTMRMWRKRMTIIFLLCKIKKKNSQNNTDGSASYQIVVNEYDKSGKLVETKSKQSVLV